MGRLKLSILSIGDNQQLKKLPLFVCNIHTLQKLDISSINLKELP